jgi:hypothetical protein
MKPKEKAQELIKKFSFNTRCFSETKGWEDCFFDAKECALIAVDEICEEFDHFPFNDDEYLTNNRQYWQQVKQEIENL